MSENEAGTLESEVEAGLQGIGDSAPPEEVEELEGVEPESEEPEVVPEVLEDEEEDADFLKIDPKTQEKINRRIGKYSHKAKTAEREKLLSDQRAEAAERKAAELEQKFTPKVARPVRPKIDDPGIDYDEELLDQRKDEYFEDLADYKAGQRFESIRTERDVEQRRADAEKITADYTQKIFDSGIEGYSKKAEALSSSFQQNDPRLTDLYDTLIKVGDPRVETYLGEHLEQAHKIASMGVENRAAEIGKISARFSAQKPVIKSKAPKPVETAGSGGVQAKKDEDLTMEELEAKLYG